MVLLNYPFEMLMVLIVLYAGFNFWHKFYRVNKSPKLTGDQLVELYCRTHK